MSRPYKLICYKIGDELHKDVDEIMKWPVKKVMEYIAYKKTQDEEWRNNYENSLLPPKIKALKENLIKKSPTIRQYSGKRR